MAENPTPPKFVRIARKIFDHEFWDEKRSFSKFEAWLDLIQTARYDPGEQSEWIKGKDIKYKRGQIPCSIRFLQKRWNWGSITKVEKFLKALENKDMVVLEKGQGQFVVTICKYDYYNPLKDDERTVKRQQGGQQKDESKKERKKEYKDIVFLSDLEYERLCTEFTKETTDKAIQFFSDWGKEKPKKFKESSDHNRSIRRWVIEAVSEPKQKKDLFSNVIPESQVNAEEF